MDKTLKNKSVVAYYNHKYCILLLKYADGKIEAISITNDHTKAYVYPMYKDKILLDGILRVDGNFIMMSKRNINDYYQNKYSLQEYDVLKVIKLLNTNDADFVEVEVDVKCHSYVSIDISVILNSLGKLITIEVINGIINRITYETLLNCERNDLFYVGGKYVFSDINMLYTHRGQLCILYNGNYYNAINGIRYDAVIAKDVKPVTNPLMLYNLSKIIHNN